MVSALRASITTVDRTDVLSVKARRAATVGDASSTTRFSDDALTTPVRASAMVYVLNVAHSVFSSMAASARSYLSKDLNIRPESVSRIPLQ